jgi:hypothetical protein
MTPKNSLKPTRNPKKISKYLQKRLKKIKNPKNTEKNSYKINKGRLTSTTCNENDFIYKMAPKFKMEVKKFF